MAVEQKKYFHRTVTDKLVTINEDDLELANIPTPQLGSPDLDTIPPKLAASCATADSKTPRSLRRRFLHFVHLRGECSEMTS